MFEYKTLLFNQKQQIQMPIVGMASSLLPK